MAERFLGRIGTHARRGVLLPNTHISRCFFAADDIK